MKKRLFAKKTLAMTMAALMAAGMLAGCSSGSKETTAAPAGDTAAAAADTTAAGGDAAPAEGTGEAVTIKFRYWADNTDYSALMQEIIAKFNAENGKGITVVGEESPWDGGAYSENLFNAKMGGGDVDCATWPP